MALTGSSPNGMGPQQTSSPGEISPSASTTPSSVESVEGIPYEKHDVTVDTTSTAPEISSGGSPLRPWKSAFLRWGPLAGLLSMGIAILGIFASLGILAASNATPVTSWSAPPSTYLAIFTAIANLSMRYACIQGVVIAWWHRALRGTTLARLHHDWRAGTTLPGALSSGRNIGLLGLACLASNFVVIDGPLLQRSSTVVTAPLVDSRTRLNVSMAPEISSNFSGSWGYIADMNVPSGWSNAFNDTVPVGDGTTSNLLYLVGDDNDMQIQLRVDYMLETPLAGIVTGCDKTCEAKLHAPAFAVTACQHRSLPVNYTRDSQTIDEIMHLANKWKAPSLNEQGIVIAMGLELGEIEKAYLFTGFFDGSDCVGTFSYSACTLQSAIGEYDIKLDGEVMTLVNPANPTIVALANNTQTDRLGESITSLHGHRSTLAGILSLVKLNQESYVTMTHEPGNRSEIAVLLTDSDAASAFQRPDGDSIQLCPRFSDPHAEIMKNMNELMVRAGANMAAQNSSLVAQFESRTDPGTPSFHRAITGYRTGDHDVYHTNYKFFFAAALVEVLCVAMIAPLYWGWWKLGRHMTFSPLEMAKAFRSPLLADYNSNCSGRELAKSAGDRHVRYGATQPVAANGTMTLGFEDPSTVDKPIHGMRFGV